MMDLQTLLVRLDDPNSFLRLGLIVERCADGAIRANVRHVPHHSPTGYECGYQGSGPADLALAVLHALIPPLSEADEEAQYALPEAELGRLLDDDARWSERMLRQERVSRLAYRLHQDFKSEFIATMPRAGGFIPIEAIRAWVESRCESRANQRG